MTEEGRASRQVEHWWQPAFEWRPWEAGYRLPVELGPREFLRETLRRAGVTIALTLTLVLLPVILIVLALLAIAMGQTNDNPQDSTPTTHQNCDRSQLFCPAMGTVFNRDERPSVLQPTLQQTSEKECLGVVFAIVPCDRTYHAARDRRQAGSTLDLPTMNATS
jgi:hypothetical protein